MDSWMYYRSYNGEPSVSDFINGRLENVFVKRRGQHSCRTYTLLHRRDLWRGVHLSRIQVSFRFVWKSLFDESGQRQETVRVMSYSSPCEKIKRGEDVCGVSTGGSNSLDFTVSCNLHTSSGLSPRVTFMSSSTGTCLDREI